MSRVLPAFKGQTVACIASGPSLTAEQVEVVRKAGIPALVCNDSYLIAPFAHVLYWADSKWLKWHLPRQEFKAFAGERCTIQSSTFQADDPEIHVLKNGGGEGLSTDPSSIFTGSHSGYQLLNIATLTGASRILLLGYDCQRVNGKRHFFGDHPDGTEPPYAAIKTRYTKAADIAEKMGISIINCTPGSALDQFPKQTIESALADKANAVVSA